MSDPSASKGCTKLYLITTPYISMDFNSALWSQGREKSHIGAIRAAVDAGVKHVYYTSLAFGPKSGAGVMRAHLRTEAFLKGLEGEGLRVTVLREGIYNNSWPLYLVYFDPQGDERGEVLLAGDGRIIWTAIKNSGLGSAIGGARSSKEFATLVAKAKGEGVSVKVVGTEKYVDHYVKRGSERSSVEWRSSTYRALDKGECLIEDSTLDELLAGRGVKPTTVEKTLEKILKH
ncbi:hypothetical protein BUE80_DR001082 [Diplocarpon rosae]|nr:hypothetical protein BUE80_DR001082 [Diplocarpon rosae]